MKSITKYIAGAGIIAGILLYVGRSTSHAPDNAIVYVDIRANTYVPQIYGSGNDDFLRRSTYLEVKRRGLKPKYGFDDFWQDRRLIFEILNINIWKQPDGKTHFKPRWNNDGSWNW